MNVIKTDILDVYILEPRVLGDSRGWFMETWSIQDMEKLGFNYHFVQDNQSYSSQKGILRGIHFQKGDKAQAKLVRCGRGAVLDVAIDLRVASPTYKKWVAVELSADNKRQLLIPRGFGHAFLTLTDEVEFIYKVDNLYAPMAEGNILWNDPQLNINWGITSPIMSDKDQRAPLLKDADFYFAYGG